MKQRLVLLISGFIAWTLYFLLARGLFLIYHHGLASELPPLDIFLIFVHGIRMDFSMAGYFSLLPGMMLGILFFRNGKAIWPYWFGYHIVVLFISSFIIVLDFELYRNWGFRMDATPLMYIGKEAAGSGDLLTSILLVLYCILIFSVSLFAWRKYFKPRFERVTQTTWTTLPALVMCTALFFFPIRGSLGVAPMNSGFVYFHEKNVFANHSAVNVVWNFLYAVQKINKQKYSDKYFDKTKTEEHMRTMFPLPDSTAGLLRIKKPNVIIIVLESYTSGLIGVLGGLPDVTPRLNALAKEGILFDHFFASGDRTEKGIIAILNGYPSQPVTSIVKEPKKTESLPYLNKVFKANGYRTEFTYGYNINYANFNSYLMNGDFDHVTHSVDFPQELNTSKWGVHDHYVFDKFFDELQACTTPFFKFMMTQSSHEPFQVPMETVIQGGDEKHMFYNSAYYTDKSLGEFIDKAKKTSWWENTLVVITADHGHPYPNNPGVSNPDKFKIPFLWVGGALNVRDTVIHTVAGQTDIANTVLGQLGLYSTDFTFSHNILAKSYDPVAVYIFNNGFGVVKKDKLLVYDNVAHRIIREDGSPDSVDLDDGMAYMQTLYWDYNSRGKGFLHRVKHHNAK